MEVILIKRAGVPHAEIAAHQQIQREFSATAFSKNWKAYASFALARRGRGAGDDDFDLVLVTHSTVAIIELKNWNGKLLESDGRRWFVDGEDKGDSPVGVVNRKVPKLADVMKQKLGAERTPFIKAFVVMHGKLGDMKLPPEEARSVLTMTEFLSFRFESVYRQYLGGRPRFNPLDNVAAYDSFFQGSAFKPKTFYIDGFRPDAVPIFEHPKNLYREYKAVARDDPNTLALLRQWDFSSLGLDLIGETDRAFIGLREQRVYQHVADHNEELSLSLLRPLSRKGPKDVTLDFAELYALPAKVTRLTEFRNSVLPKLSTDERVVLVKAVLSRFADLHDVRVAHRDVGDHSVWLERPSRVLMSGFPAAYYPQLKTVGSFRDRIKVEQSLLPEDVVEDKASTPYRRDVFMIGALTYLILYGEKPPIADGVFTWSARAVDPFNGALDRYFSHALSRDAENRFPSARELLDAFNAATSREQASIIDFASFEAFKAETKERDYPDTEVLLEEEHRLYYRADTADTKRVVKVWYGAEPDPRKPDLSLRLLSFLERARTIRGCGFPGVPSVIDFGLTRGSLLLVLKWVDGDTLPEWLSKNPELPRRLKVAESMLDTIDRLHAVELAHGDVHPKNVVITADDAAVFIDVLDFHLKANDVYTTAYLPENYASLSPFERDRYSLAAVLTEVFNGNREKPVGGPFPIARVYEELTNLLSAETLPPLSPLRSALLSAQKPDQEDIPEFQLAVPNLAYYGVPAGELRTDNGQFHVSVQQDRRVPNTLRIWVTGIGRQVSFVWKKEERSAEQVRAASVPQSQLLRSQMLRDMAVKMRLRLVDAPAADVVDLAHYLAALPQLQHKFATGAVEKADDEQPEDADATPERTADIPIETLWQALLDAEEEAFLTVTVAGEKRRSQNRDGQILVPYHIDTRVIDYQATDIVLVESQASDGTWKPAGQVNLRDTTFGQLAELAIDQPHFRANFKIGSKLRLVSTLEKGSFTRRRFAVERVLDDKAVVPRLIEYFTGTRRNDLVPTTYPAPSEEDLDTYSEGEKKLNESQKDAFRRVLSNGPISLLQGPPGTGKTWFIASLLHYLMTKERARRILLVSQAHEAVNNALEKALELCRSKDVSFEAVRLGSESAASDAIRHLHAGYIEESYRERFKAEQKGRIVNLAVALGLPRTFAEAAVDLYLRLGMLSERISRLQARTGTEDERAIASLDARARALSETFFEIARDVYDFHDVLPPSEVVRQLEDRFVAEHELRSRDAIARFHKVLRLSEEWVSALGSPDANFSEFLAKSRTVVAGTLVGIGYRGAGVVQNIFDWVIIDEAGRAAPSELAVAMQAGHRILLVGDHQQLPPTFSKEVRDAVKHRFDVQDDSALFASDLKRVFDSPYGQRVGSTLLTQYRMAPDIGALVSACFYDDKLETGRGPCPEYYDLLPDHLQNQVTWIDTSSLGDRAYEQSSDDDEDKWNQTEARTVMGLLRQIIEAEEFMAFLAEDLEPQEPAIGVICMYDRQRELVDQMKAEATWLGDFRRVVKVDTVDSYQGKENRIIILSTVRNNPRMRPGFLRNPNRINVAMSRAMERLYVVGASGMWRGRNMALPLGKVLTKIDEFAAAGRAAFLNADHFLRA